MCLRNAQILVFLFIRTGAEQNLPVQLAAEAEKGFVSPRRKGDHCGNKKMVWPSTFEGTLA